MIHEIVWKKALDGYVSLDGVWKIRGPLFGKRIFWIYKNGQRFCETEKYDSAVSKPSLNQAKKYVQSIAQK